MKVLVACEFSATVRDAFRALGHDAWSCDLLPTEGDPRWHIEGDVLPVLRKRWDIVISHPPCTFLANSSAKHLYKDMKKENGRNEDRWVKMEKAAIFYCDCLDANAEYVAAENPIIHEHARKAIEREWERRHPGTILPKVKYVQPWQFGHGETKATGFRLINLKPLVPTNIVEGREQKVHRRAPSPDRWKERSRTYQGIADAMAMQWGGYDL